MGLKREIYKLFEFVDISSIFDNHFKLFKENHSKFLFIGLPTLIMLGFSYYGKYTKELQDVITNSLSIFIGFFISILVFLPSVITAGKGKYIANRYKLVKELFYNVNYLTAISLICLLIVFIKSFFTNSNFITYLFNSNIILIYSNVCLTLFMILKRVHVLFNYDLKEEIKSIEKDIKEEQSQNFN